jgi:hypothetical protein
MLEEAVRPLLIAGGVKNAPRVYLQLRGVVRGLGQSRGPRGRSDTRKAADIPRAPPISADSIAPAGGFGRGLATEAVTQSAARVQIERESIDVLLTGAATQE